MATRALFLAAAAVALASAILATHPNARRLTFLLSALSARAFPALRPFLPALNGDGREAAAAAYVLSHSPPGNASAAISAFEEYAHSTAWMMAVGPIKGRIVAAALAATPGNKVLELGTYCGYGSMVLAAAAPEAARIYSVEVSEEFARVARAILSHAGLSGRVSVLVGPLAAHLPSLAALPPAGPFDFVFVDHDKDAYLPDVQALLRTPGLVREGEGQGTVLAVDNLKVPGAPAMVDWLKSRPENALQTAWHRTELEFVKGIPDVVAVSRVVSAAGALKEKGDEAG